MIGEEVELSDDIYFLATSGSEWLFLKKMKTPRAFHSSLPLSALVLPLDIIDNKIILSLCQRETKTTFIGEDDFILLGGARRRKRSDGTPVLAEHISLDKNMKTGFEIFGSHCFNRPIRIVEFLM